MTSRFATGRSEQALGVIAFMQQASYIMLAAAGAWIASNDHRLPWG